jgi:hypothetical protein
MAPRVVPWVSWSEWESVRNSLYDDGSASRIWGVEVVSMWRSRGRVPHAADSTSQLVEVQINDFCSRTYSPDGSQLRTTCSSVCGIQRSEYELRMQYSIAVLRTVNGFVDQNQTGYFADSVMTLAERIGLPGWIVELRHDATHNHLPSIAVLRAATSSLLAFMWHNYWGIQSNHLSTLSASCRPPPQHAEGGRDRDGGGGCSVPHSLKPKRRRSHEPSPMAVYLAALPSMGVDSDTLGADVVAPLLIEDMLEVVKEEEGEGEDEDGDGDDLFDVAAAELRFAAWRPLLAQLTQQNAATPILVLCRLFKHPSTSTSTSISIARKAMVQMMVDWMLDQLCELTTAATGDTGGGGGGGGVGRVLAVQVLRGLITTSTSTSTSMDARSSKLAVFCDGISPSSSTQAPLTGTSIAPLPTAAEEGIGIETRIGAGAGVGICAARLPLWSVGLMVGHFSSNDSDLANVVLAP